jgi:DNA-directed RNA polymerase subunit RPC12/RpoP
MPHPESFAKCACLNCGGHIEFPLEGAGQKITCPHCGEPTLLAVTHAGPVEIGGGPAARKRIYLAFAMAACVMALAGGGAYFYFNHHNSQQEVAAPVRPDQTSNFTSVASAPIPPPKRKTPPDPWHGLKPGKVSLEKKGDSQLIYAIGTLTNDTTRQRFGVKVEIDVLDAHRNKLGSATDYTEVIEPGKEWKFRALVTDKTATAVKLTNVKEQE